jgi:hypothetical protein
VRCYLSISCERTFERALGTETNLDGIASPLSVRKLQRPLDGLEARLVA